MEKSQKTRILVMFTSFTLVCWFFATPVLAILLGCETSRSAKLVERCNQYERVLDRVYEDQPDYYVDVLCESDEMVELNQ